MDGDRLRVVITVRRSRRTRYVDVVEGDQISEYGVLIGCRRRTEIVEGVRIAGKASRIRLKDTSIGVERDNGSN